MKIPTLLILILLSALIIVGINAKPYLSQVLPTKNASASFAITQSNLTPQSITISWFTNTLVPSELIYTTDKNFWQEVKSAKDDRDQEAQNHNLHFVTLQELLPSTTYYFKIGSQPVLSSSNQFTTPPQIKNTDLKIPPLVGSVASSNLQPLSDALVVLEIPNYFPLFTYTNQTGNFVLPIKLLFKKSDLTQTLDLSQSSDITLIISKDNQASKINLKLENVHTPLPPVILGQDLDLTYYQSTNSANLANLQPTPAPQFNFDVNGDGIINSLDLSMIQSNIGKKKFNPKADINGDGSVDQIDLDLIKQAIQNTLK